MTSTEELPKRSQNWKRPYQTMKKPGQTGDQILVSEMRRKPTALPCSASTLIHAGRRPQMLLKQQVCSRYRVRATCASSRVFEMWNNALLWLETRIARTLERRIEQIGVYIDDGPATPGPPRFT